MRYLKSHKALISIAATATCLVTAILHTISMLSFYDEWGYFVSGAILPIISCALVAFSVAAFVAGAYLCSDKDEQVNGPQGVVGYISLLPAATMLIHAAGLVSSAVANADLFSVALLISALASAVFFIMIPFSKEYGSITALCGVGFIIWLGLSWMSSYNDLYIPMNSPEKLFFHFGCIGAALLTVGELRAMFGIPKPALFRFSLWSAQLLTLTAALPTAVKFILKNAKTSMFSEHLVLLFLAVYAIARGIAITVADIREKKESTDNEEN